MSESHLRKSDSIVIVGASRGIGANLAHLLVDAGYLNLHLVARDSKKLEALKKELKVKNSAVTVRTYARDMCSEKDLMAFIHELQNDNAFPRQWVLSIGGSPTAKLMREPFESSPWEHLRGLVELNLMAPMRIMHQIVPELMRPNADGDVEPATIVSIASQAAHHPRPGTAVYAAAKHGLWGLMRSVGEEVKDLGIRVSIVSPGMVDTDLLPANPNQDRKKMIPPSDVSRAILFALECSPATAPFEIHLKPQRAPG